MKPKRSTISLEQEVLDDLINRVKEGDDEAFRELYDALSPAIYQYSIKLLGNDEDAKDVLQDSFVQAFKKIGDLQENEKVLSWMYAISYRKCLHIWRKRRRSDRATERLQRECDIGEVLIVPDPASGVEVREVHLLIQNEIAELTESQRSAVVLFYLQGFSIKEIATIQNSSVSGVKSLLFKARKRMLNKMKQSGHLSSKDIISTIIFAQLLSQEKSVLAADESELIFEGIIRGSTSRVATMNLVSVKTRVLKLFSKTTFISLLSGLIASVTLLFFIVSYQVHRREETEIISGDTEGEELKAYVVDQAGNQSEKTVGNINLNIPAPMINNIDAGDTTISGKGEPGRFLEIVLPRHNAVTSVVNLDGEWVADLPAPLREGDIVVVRAVETSGTYGFPTTVMVDSFENVPAESEQK